ncbi:MAG: glutathione S-transferase family protein [Magnetococcales bacterium]|nr:glutathione S-transferase family protein [Magnetococcales bacterium]NGZ28751.1 glutathione S-transferase family protein [Magnetococcales bacterium]
MFLEMYQFLSCPYCHRASVAIALSGLPCTFHTVDPANKPESFLHLWPQGSVPLLVVDGVHLLPDSTAISEYLNDRVDGRLHPSKLEERALHRYAIEVIGASLRLLGPVMTAREEAAMVQAWHGVIDSLGELEESLEAGHLVREGESPMLLDAALATVALRLREYTALGHPKLVLDDIPLVAAWGDGLLADPIIRSAMPHPFTPIFRRLVIMRGKGGYLASLLENGTT